MSDMEELLDLVDGFDPDIESYEDLVKAILDWHRNKINSLELCTNIDCDSGRVVTDKVSEDGKFVLADCPECGGRGFRQPTQ